MCRPSMMAHTILIIRMSRGSTFAGPIPEEISRILIERTDSIGGVGSTLGQGEKQRLL